MRKVALVAMLLVAAGVGLRSFAQDAPDPKKDAPKKDAPKKDEPKKDEPTQDAPNAPNAPAATGSEKKDEKPKDPTAEIKRRLAVQKITVNFDGTPFSEAIEFLRDITGIDYVVDPSVDATAKVTMRVRDVKLENLLSLCLAAAKDSTYEVFAGVVYITTKSKKWQEPAKLQLPDALKKTLETKKVTVNLEDSPLSEVGAFLHETLGVSFALDEKAAKLKVTLRFRDAVAGDVVRVLERVTGTTVEVVGEGLSFKKS